MKKRKKVVSVLNLNVKKLVKMVGFGYVNGPVRFFSHDITPDGQPRVVPALGGVVFDYRLGDSVNKYNADHLQPGISISANDSFLPSDSENQALFTYTCIGNEVEITDTRSNVEGYKGIVTGKHGGVNYIMAQFPESVLKKIGKKAEVKIELYGLGLKDLSHPGIHFMNIDPSILVQMPINEIKNSLVFPVVKVIPAEAMGSGIGSTEATGDYDIMSTHESSKDLKIGDFVCINDNYAYIAPGYMKNAVTIGVVVHGGCIDSGHGPGLLPILTCDRGNLKTYIDKKSNLKKYI